MSFEVDTSALRQASRRLRALADDVGSAERYASTYVALDRSDRGLVIAGVLDANERVSARLDDALRLLGSLLDRSGQELAAAAHRYDECDAAAAALSDALVPPVAGAGLARQRGTSW